MFRAAALHTAVALIRRLGAGQTGGGLAVAALLLLAGCATFRQVRALRQVEFSIERVSRVRLAGVDMEGVRSWEDLGLLDGAVIATAYARGELPLGFFVHVRAFNPDHNRTTARLVRMEWAMWLNERETVSGVLDTVYMIPPGQAVDVPLRVDLELLRFFRTSGREAVDLALGLLGYSARATEVQLRVVPIVDTPLGAIRYGSPLVIRRRVGG